MTEAPGQPSAVPALVPVDKRDVAYAVLKALSRRRYGHQKAELESVRNQVVAELIAEALLEDGYILARHPATPIGPDLFTKPHRT